MSSPIDEIKKTKDESRIFEVYQVTQLLCYRRAKSGGAPQEVAVETLDAGASAQEHRRSVQAKTEDGTMATWNPAATIEEALSIVHWDDLDREP